VGLLNKLFGFRWSLYIVQDGNKLAYAMHENSVVRMLGYVMGYYSNGGRPVEPWSLHLNFNHKQKSIELGPEHFSSTGENVTPELIRQISAIDSGWKVKGNEPVFEDAVTKKKLKISNRGSGEIDLQAMIDNVGSAKEPTFHSVMGQVFGKKC